MIYIKIIIIYFKFLFKKVEKKDIAFIVLENDIKEALKERSLEKINHILSTI